MEFEKTNDMNSLYDFYADLLTDKQRTYVELYYGDDYSLGEIAENFAVSRQAVYDNISRTEKILRRYEDQLHLVRDFQARVKIGSELLSYCQAHYPHDQQLRTYIQQLLSTDEDFEIEPTKEV